jgi:hypothetical protein
LGLLLVGFAVVALVETVDVLLGGGDGFVFFGLGGGVAALEVGGAFFAPGADGFGVGCGLGLGGVVGVGTVIVCGIGDGAAWADVLGESMLVAVALEWFEVDRSNIRRSVCRWLGMSFRSRLGRCLRWWVVAARRSRRRRLGGRRRLLPLRLVLVHRWRRIDLRHRLVPLVLARESRRRRRLVGGHRSHL